MLYKKAELTVDRKRITGKKNIKNTTALGFEETLWLTADKLRCHMDAAVYKHTVLGLVFLKSDSFNERYNELVTEGDGFEEERDAYTEKNVFWVPKSARWDNIKNSGKKPEIGKIIDDEMVSIENGNLLQTRDLLLSKLISDDIELKELDV